MPAAFGINMGMKQDCSASPYVFFLFFDRVCNFIAAYTPPYWYVHTIFLALLATFILLYGDNIVLIADSPECFQYLLHAFACFADTNEMCISQDKTQVLLFCFISPAAPLTC